MTKRGRPSKATSEAANGPAQTEPATKNKQPKPVRTQPVVRRSERIANKNHETSTSAGRAPASVKPSGSGAATKSATPPSTVGGVKASTPPQPTTGQAWSASPQEIAAINLAITRHSAYVIS